MTGDVPRYRPWAPADGRQHLRTGKATICDELARAQALNPRSSLQVPPTPEKKGPPAVPWLEVTHTGTGLLDPERYRQVCWWLPSAVSRHISHGHLPAPVCFREGNCIRELTTAPMGLFPKSLPNRPQTSGDRAPLSSLSRELTKLPLGPSRL